MATAILRPNSTIVNAWSGGSHLSVDEVVEDPDNGDDVELIATEAAGDNNDVVSMGFPNTIDDVDEVTNIRVKTLASSVGSGQPETSVYMNMAWQGEVNIPTGGEAWHNTDFAGSWDQDDLDALQVMYRADCGAKNDWNHIDVCYVIITYTQVAVGYGHDFMGVPTANIGSVCGVPTANIDKIKGV